MTFGTMHDKPVKYASIGDRTKDLLWFAPMPSWLFTAESYPEKLDLLKLFIHKMFNIQLSMVSWIHYVWTNYYSETVDSSIHVWFNLLDEFTKFQNQKRKNTNATENK